MPLYELTVTTSAQQAESAANTASVELEHPVITEGMVFIDRASNGEVRAQLRVGETPVLPHSNAATVSVPGRNGPAPINRRLPGVPGDVELRAWAPDADFAHDVIAQVEAVSEDNATQQVRVVGAGQPDSGPTVQEAAEELGVAGDE